MKRGDFMAGIPFNDASSDPLFRPFTWHDADIVPSYLKKLAEHGHDIANGIAILLSLIEFHESEALDGRPLLSEVDKGTLLRLAIASSKLLAHFAYMQIEEENCVKRKTSQF